MIADGASEQQQRSREQSIALRHPLNARRGSVEGRLQCGQGYVDDCAVHERHRRTEDDCDENPLAIGLGTGGLGRRCSHRNTRRNEVRLGNSSRGLGHCCMDACNGEQSSMKLDPVEDQDECSFIFDRGGHGPLPTQGDEKLLLSSNDCPSKHRPRLCHLDRSTAEWRDLRF